MTPPKSEEFVLINRTSRGTLPAETSKLICADETVLLEKHVAKKGHRGSPGEDKVPQGFCVDENPEEHDSE